MKLHRICLLLNYRLGNSQRWFYLNIDKKTNIMKKYKDTKRGNNMTLIEGQTIQCPK